MAVYVNDFFEERVEQRAPDAGRLTKDVDIAVRRVRRTAGVDMLVQADSASARRAVNLVYAGEKVRPEHLTPMPELSDSCTVEGFDSSR